MENNILIQDLIDSDKLRVAVLDELEQAEKELRKTELYKRIQQLKLQQFELEKEKNEKELVIVDNMRNFNIKKIELIDKTITLKKSPGSIKWTNDTVIPSDYWKEKITKTVDKEKLKEDIKNGLSLPNVFIDYNYSLQITHK